MDQEQVDVSQHGDDQTQIAVPKQNAEVYLDPEGGYKNPEEGRAAEIAAMTK